LTLIVTFFTFVTYLEENEVIRIKDNLDMKRLNDIMTLVLAGVEALLWADADVDMERVPCRVNRERITM